MLEGSVKNLACCRFAAFLLAAVAFDFCAPDSSSESLDVLMERYTPVEIATGRYGEGPSEFSLGKAEDGVMLGIAAFCVGQDDRLFVADAVSRRVAVYDQQGAFETDIACPQGWDVIRVAACDERLYALCRDAELVTAACERRQDAFGSHTGGWVEGRESERTAGKLRLLTRMKEEKSWSVGPAVVPAPVPGECSVPIKDVCDRVRLIACDGEIYFYDYLSRRSVRLTEHGQSPSQAGGDMASVGGWLLSPGVSVAGCGAGLCLRHPDGSQESLAWLSGSVVGGDSAGRLYVCEIADTPTKPHVFIAVYGPKGVLRARWRLPDRPGDVRMLGPRIVVSPNKAVYEFWSSSDAFHIVRWRHGGRSKRSALP